MTDESPVLPTDYPDLLPPNKTKLERAIAGPTGRIDHAIPVPIDLLLRPWDIPFGYLPWLSWHMSLDLWDWRWDEYKKRAVTARAVELNRMKGTAEAIQVYTEIMDSETVQILVPPQEFFVGENLSKADRDVWIKQMPEVRIKLIQGEGIAEYPEFYIQANHAEHPGSPEDPWPLPPTNDAQFGFIGNTYFMLDQGPVLYGRRVIIRQNGVDTPAQYVVTTTEEYEGQVVEVERVPLPGESTVGFFLGVDFLGEEKFLDAEEKEPQLITLRLDGSYVHETSTLGLDLVLPDLQPRSPRYERTSDIGDAGPHAFIDDMFIGAADRYEDIDSGDESYDYPHAIIARNRAGDMLADRIYLIDPTVPVPFMQGLSYIGVDRIGMPAYTADVMVDLKTKDNTNFFLDANDFIGGPSFVNDYDTYYMDRAIQALRSAKAARDKVCASFAPFRQITSTDVLTPETEAGDWVRDRL
jgi:phage tail P2-like protein